MPDNINKDRGMALELMIQATKKLADFSTGYNLSKFSKDQKNPKRNNYAINSHRRTGQKIA